MRYVVVAAMVLLAGCAAAPLSVDAYAQAMTRTSDGYVAESQAVSAQYQSSVVKDIKDMLATDQDDRERRAVEITSAGTVNYLTLVSDAMTRFLDVIEALDPPSEIAPRHAEFIDAVRSVRDAIPATRDAVVAARSIDGIRFALTASGFADGQNRWIATCTALEASLRAQGTGIALGCVRAGVTP